MPLTTDAARLYTAPHLLPGTYNITATAWGFATEVQSGVALTVGAQQVLNLTLRGGRTTEKVQVAGEAPAVQLATSSLSAVVNSTTVRELPLNGRSWTDLATLQPGVAGIQTQSDFAAGGNRGNRGFGAQVAIDGARPQQNNYRLDGVGLDDYANGAPGSVLGNTTLQVPSLKSASGPVRWLANGWELGGILKATNGLPFTATFGTDGDPLGLLSSDPWDFPNRLTGPGCASLINPENPNNYTKTLCFAIPAAPSLAFYNANCDPVNVVVNGPSTPTFPFPLCTNLRGNAGRNILIGPSTVNLDFSVFKNNYVRRISEAFDAQFRAELFNILNRANFAVPSNPNDVTIFASTRAPGAAAGLLTSNTTTAREIQFALKVVW
jgi:hypothetical protein